MGRRIVAVIGFVLLVLVVPVRGQTAKRLQWDMPEPITQVTPYSWVYQIDALPAVQATATCTGNTIGSICSIPFPAANPGSNHAIVVWAVSAVGLEGGHSASFPFSIPSTPSNLRVP